MLRKPVKTSWRTAAASRVKEREPTGNWDDEQGQREPRGRTAPGLYPFFPYCFSSSFTVGVLRDEKR